jgi:hypothetical protein
MKEVKTNVGRFAKSAGVIYSPDAQKMGHG